MRPLGRMAAEPHLALTKRWSKKRPVTFVVGSALTAPYHGNPGFPTVDGVIELIRDRLE